MKKVTIKIFGTVQGVGFRYAAKKEAQKVNVVAEPRNEPDGSVHIEAFGLEKDLEQFLSWCRKGPRAAHVDRIQSEWADHP